MKKNSRRDFDLDQTMPNVEVVRKYTNIIYYHVLKFQVDSLIIFGGCLVNTHTHTHTHTNTTNTHTHMVEYSMVEKLQL